MALSTPLQFQTCLQLSECNEAAMEEYLFQVLLKLNELLSTIHYKPCLQCLMQMVMMSGVGGLHHQEENVQVCVKLSQRP